MKILEEVFKREKEGKGPLPPPHPTACNSETMVVSTRALGNQEGTFRMETIFRRERGKGGKTETKRKTERE